MNHFGGLDVSVKETSICIVDDTGRIVREVKVRSEPEALLEVLGNLAYRFKRIGLEAGPLSQWLFSALAEAGLPVVCVETRHMRAVLKAQINKTDRNDARGIAQKHHPPCHSSLAMHRARMRSMLRKLTTPSTSRPRTRSLLQQCELRNHSAFPRSLWEAEADGCPAPRCRCDRQRTCMSRHNFLDDRQA
jgi:transposase